MRNPRCAKASRVSGSFRDPSGFLYWKDGHLFRNVSISFREDYERCRDSSFYARAMDGGLLVPHEEVRRENGGTDDGVFAVLRPEVVPFVSYPYEWSFSQLRDAALLTIDLQLLALEHDLSLKDASAFNVQFHRGRPIFIDTLSFERYPANRPWVAYQQFCRHFLAPLALIAVRGPEFGRYSRVHLDGLPLDFASSMLPARTWFAPRILSHIHLHARSQRTHQGRRDSAEQARESTLSRVGLQGLVESLRATVRRLNWEPSGTEWGDYYDDTNYSERAEQHKHQIVAECLEELRPRNVWDLGANTGRFSRLAAQRGIHTVAFDVDPAAVEKNYREMRRREEEDLLPLVLDLTNPSPSIGWNLEERMSLADRGPADLIMALALVHHLALSNNVPLDLIARNLRRLGRFAIVEFVPKSDTQAQRLLLSRKDIFPDYDEEGFETALRGSFEIRRRIPIADSQRTLYVLQSVDSDPRG